MYSEDYFDAIREARDAWESETLEPVLGTHGERWEYFATVSKHKVDRLYTPEDVAGLDYEPDLVFPGGPPFTRGPYPTCTEAAPG
jgi:methylmalonyl-CoA mutase N-terminal domain/subunit